MRKIAILLLLVSQVSLFAQDYKFGKVTKEELQERFYPLDSNAEAAYLYKYRRTYFSYNQQKGFQVITDVHDRVKIYEKEGFKYATTLIDYYTPDVGEDQEVSSIKGYVFNIIKGKVTKDKLSSEDVFTEHKNEFWSVKKVTMPNVKVGSVIDFKYKITSPYNFISELHFQHRIPVKNLAYKVTIPEYYTYKTKVKGYYFITPKISRGNSSLILNFKNRSSRSGGSWGASKTSYSNNEIKFSTNVREFKAKEIPALKDDEPFVSNIGNYRGGVKFELASTDFIKVGGDLKYYSETWEDVSKQIYNSSSFGFELAKSNYYKEELAAILSTTTSVSDKIGTIFQFVKSKVTWNGFYGKYVKNGTRKAFKEGVGNVADINLMLTAMLRSAGFNANPVLVSTRDHGISITPTLNGFNYVISMVEFEDGTYALLDATEPYSLPNVLPSRVLNWNGRKVTKQGRSSWVKLTPLKHALKENSMMVKITNDLMVNGIIRTIYSQLNALNFRKNYNHSKEEKLITQFEEDHNVEVENFKITNQENIGKSIIRNVKFTSEDLVEEINGNMYIEPLLFLTEVENPFKLEDRKFPVDFASPWKVKNTVSIQIPKGYKISTLPTSFAIGMPNNIGVFKYRVSEIGKNIKTTAILQFNTAIIGAENYKTLKLFYGDLVKKQSEKIVLVKE